MLTREEIFAKKVGHDIVTLPSGGQVRVRGLSRDEAAGVQEREGTLARDNYVITAGLVEPALTEDEVAEWGRQEGAAGDLVEVSRAIARLSGMSEGAGKSGPSAS
jgi:hypothetical protein